MSFMAMTVGNVLGRHMKDQRLTLKDLGKDLKIDYRLIHAYVNHEKAPGQAKAARLRKVLGQKNLVEPSQLDVIFVSQEVIVGLRKLKLTGRIGVNVREPRVEKAVLSDKYRVAVGRDVAIVLGLDVPYSLNEMVDRHATDKSITGVVVVATKTLLQTKAVPGVARNVLKAAIRGCRYTYVLRDEKSAKLNARVLKDQLKYFSEHEQSKALWNIFFSVSQKAFAQTADYPQPNAAVVESLGENGRSKVIFSRRYWVREANQPAFDRVDDKDVVSDIVERAQQAVKNEETPLKHY
jgi:hypothetical protein